MRLVRLMLLLLLSFPAVDRMFSYGCVLDISVRLRRKKRSSSNNDGLIKKFK